MTSDEQELAELKSQPPKIQLTKWDIVQRVIGWVSAAIAVAALTIAILVGLNGSAVAACVNTNLGQRSAPAAADAKAHIENAKVQAVAQAAQAKTSADLYMLLTGPKAEQAKEYVTFLSDFAKSRAAAAAAAVESVQYARTLQHDQDLRDAHPLGKC